MKPKGMIPGLILCLLLSGCGAKGDGSTTPETGSGGTDPSSDAAYEAMISQLQQELSELRLSQLQQSAEYEARINELESMLTEVGTDKPEPGTNDGASDSEAIGDGESTAAPQLEYTFAERDGGMIITSYLGSDSLVEIPQSINGRQVIGIGEGAFRNSSVEQVILPEGLKSVGWFAFSGSYRLRSVILPASVSLIEYGAFDGCSSALRFTCPAASYAAHYAESYGIPVIAKTS